MYDKTRRISSVLAGQQGQSKSLIRPPRRRKGAKRPNTYSPVSAKESLRAELLALKLPMQSTGPNVLLDDRGRPDEARDYNWIQERDNGPTLVRRTMHELPTEVDPNFDTPFIDAEHGSYLREHLKTDHLEPKIAQRLTNLIMKYWCVFDPKGMKYTVLGYECEIDTGNAKPIAIKNANYGERESIIMDKHIAVLEEMMHAEQTFKGKWLFKALLAPKPHQNVYNIADFKWRLCVNFIRLNQVT